MNKLIIKLIALTIIEEMVMIVDQIPVRNPLLQIAKKHKNPRNTQLPNPMSML
jgi:hypothetical protein